MTARPKVRYIRNATVQHAADGDTVALMVDLGWRHWAEMSCRLMLDPKVWFDAPERGHRDYAAAVAMARSLLPAGTEVVTESLKMTDKYGGRFDGRLWLPDGREFAALMIDAGLAMAWPEGTPKPYPPATRATP